MSTGEANSPDLSASFDLSLANSYVDDGEYDKAIDHFTMVIRLQPNCGEAFNNRGVAYQAAGDSEKALADLAKAIQLLPKSAVPYSNRGAVYLAQGDYYGALTDLNKALELDPRFGKAHHNRGLAYLNLGIPEEAIADFEKAIEFAPEANSPVLYQVPASDSVMNHGRNTQSSTDLSLTYASRGIASLG
jgi:tetratricopeptide (TPR) repeat protein